MIHTGKCPECDGTVVWSEDDGYNGTGALMFEGCEDGCDVDDSACDDPTEYFIDDDYYYEG